MKKNNPFNFKGDKTGKVEDLLSTVIASNICVGCGACAGLYQNNLKMRVDPYGAYRPYVIENGPKSGWEAESLLICPFSNDALNEDAIGSKLYRDIPGIRHTSASGYYLECLSGHVTNENERLASSSGGIITWLLKHMLEFKIVDAVVCVGETQKSDRLFDYQMINTVEQLKKCRKSRYYPVEMSTVIKEMIDFPGRIAFVGLPCFAKSIRLLMNRNDDLKQKIKHVIGLFCGHLKTRQYSMYLSRLCGVHESEIETVDFRKKIKGYPSSNYAFEVMTRKGCRHQIMMKDAYAGSWGFNLFMLDACDYCDDVMAETADIAVGDAWLPNYSCDYRGTSVVICRQKDILSQLVSGAECGELYFKGIPIDNVIQSQQGGIRHRRQGLAYRLYLDEQKGKWHPNKRVAADSHRLSILQKVVQLLRLKLKITSRKAFNSQEKRSGLKIFKGKIRVWLLLCAFVYKLQSVKIYSFYQSK